jgi:hypothetical protein
MKTNEHANEILKVRYGAGLLAVLLLVSVEFWMVCNLGRSCGQFTFAPAVQVPAMGDWFVAK